MSRSEKIEGFILKKKALLAKDLFITLFTKEHGKLTALAKGARKLTSRRAAHLQTGNLIRAELSLSHDIYYLQSTTLISGFLQLRTERYIDQIYLFLSIVDSLLPERQEEIDIYKMMKLFFARLGKGENPLTVLHDSLQRVLMVLGYIDQKHSLSELLMIVEENTGRKLPRHVIIS